MFYILIRAHLSELIYSENGNWRSDKLFLHAFIARVNAATSPKSYIKRAHYEKRIYGLLTKCEVKMAGLWPSSSLRVYGTRRSRGPWTRKKERGQYAATLTEQAWSIKDLLYSFRRNFSRGKRGVVPRGQDSSISPARVANHSAGFE